jgi:23S rRNA pseudouridine955/2504/2580 synthase
LITHLVILNSQNSSQGSSLIIDLIASNGYIANLADSNSILQFGKQRNISLQSTLTVHFLVVDPDYAGQRLDNYLHTRYKSLPKSRLYRIIRKGEVRVNKKRVDPDYRLNGGDQIRMPPLKEEKQLEKPQKISPDLAHKLTDSILVDSKFYMVINKPSGLAVHGGSGIRIGIIEALRVIYPQQKFIELAHRLDRETSGCLLIAKKPSILKEIHRLLRESGVINKYYLCLVKGRWPKQLVKIENPLEGKASTTLFKIMHQYKNTTLLEAKLETGRNHQIRLHTQQAGFPVVGDDKYGDKDFNKLIRAYGCNRLFLHAEKLSFNLLGEKISVKAPLDKDLIKCLQRLEKQ